MSATARDQLEGKSNGTRSQCSRVRFSPTPIPQIGFDWLGWRWLRAWTYKGMFDLNYRGRNHSEQNFRQKLKAADKKWRDNDWFGLSTGTTIQIVFTFELKLLINCQIQMPEGVSWCGNFDFTGLDSLEQISLLLTVQTWAHQPLQLIIIVLA